jgi:hypothetical protein
MERCAQPCRSVREIDWRCLLNAASGQVGLVLNTVSRQCLLNDASWLQMPAAAQAGL